MGEEWRTYEVNEFARIVYALMCQCVCVGRWVGVCVIPVHCTNCVFKHIKQIIMARYIFQEMSVAFFSHIHAYSWDVVIVHFHTSWVLHSVSPEKGPQDVYLLLKSISVFPLYHHLQTVTLIRFWNRFWKPYHIYPGKVNAVGVCDPNRQST